MNYLQSLARRVLKEKQNLPIIILSLQEIAQMGTRSRGTPCIMRKVPSAAHRYRYLLQVIQRNVQYIYTSALYRRQPFFFFFPGQRLCGELEYFSTPKTTAQLNQKSLVYRLFVVSKYDTSVRFIKRSTDLPIHTTSSK